MEALLVFSCFFYLFAWLVGWLGLDSAVGMVWYGIGKCIAGFVVFIYLFTYLFIVQALRSVVSILHLSYLSIFSCTNYWWWWWRWMDGSESDHILSPTYHTKLTLALDTRGWDGIVWYSIA